MEEEEEAPILRLEIVEGPRRGETLDFIPRSAVRIGRIMKGNTLPIKDPGISSKHLSILNVSAKWILRDLDSSNGTVLDASKIPPNTPFTLHHDSTIKIGESTSIRVIFLPFQQQLHVLPPRQNPRGRPARPRVPVPAPAQSEPVKPRLRPRGRGVKGVNKVQVQSVDENDASVEEVESEPVDPPARVTRKSNRGRSVVKESTVENLTLAEEKVEELKSTRNPNLTEYARPPVPVPIPDQSEPVKPRLRPRGKGAKGKDKVQVQSVDEHDASVVNLILAEEKVEEPKRTRNPSLIEISVSSDDNLDVPVVEEPNNARGKRNSKNTRGVTANVEKKTKTGVAGKRKLEKEGENGNGAKEVSDGREKGNLNEDEGNWPDLNKMTLGEWFDFLEVYLPKQIIDETEEMIDSMTQKAERLRKYIAEMQEQNAKDKMSLQR